MVCTAVCRTVGGMGAPKRIQVERKTERIELRVAPSVRAVIERASAVSGLAVGDLAYEGARRVLEEHDRLVLTGEDREAFLDALLRPPKPRRRLVEALRAHGVLTR